MILAPVVRDKRASSKFIFEFEEAGVSTSACGRFGL